MKRLLLPLVLLGAAVAAQARADALSDSLAAYRDAGAGPFTAAAGEALWTRAVTAADGKQRRCASCHTTNLAQPGRHARTGKVIKPLAPSVNPARLTKRAKIEKWLLRNCKWTFGRECTAQEKGDLLSFIASR